MEFCGRASQALDANDQATAQEKMEFKIAYLNMISYEENIRKATLQEVADGLFEDKEIEYVKLKSQEVASSGPINVTGESSFLAKLKEYPYEFEIDEDLQLASINGVKLENGSVIEDEDKPEKVTAILTFNNNQELTKGSVATVSGTAESGITSLTLQIEDTIIYRFVPENQPTEFSGTIKVDDMINLGKLSFNQEYEVTLNVLSKKENTMTAVSQVTNYTVENALQLKELATAVNEGTTFLGKTIYQTKEIDLSSVCGSAINKSWEPIGALKETSDAVERVLFDGTFDGNDKTISGIFINNTVDTKTVGLFGLVGANGTIKDLTVSGDISNDIWRGTGGVCGRNEGIIKNCTNFVNVVGVTPVGGVVGMNEGGTIEECTNSAKVTGNKFVGGICGSNNGDIKLCTNLADVEATLSIAGGIAGCTPQENATIESCKNTGNVTSQGNPDTQAETQGTGGIVGRIEATANIIKCANKGNITATTGYFAGGIVGFTKNSSIQQCYNTDCKISTKMNGAAGLVGRADGIVMKNCYNYFSSDDYYISATATARAGGLIGNVVQAENIARIENSYCIGENIEGRVKGCIIAHNNADTTQIVNCYMLLTSSLPEIGINDMSVEPIKKEINKKTDAEFKADKTNPSSVAYLIDKNNGTDEIWGSNSSNGGYPYLKNAPQL